MAQSITELFDEFYELAMRNVDWASRDFLALFGRRVNRLHFQADKRSIYVLHDLDHKPPCGRHTHRYGEWDNPTPFICHDQQTEEAAHLGIRQPYAQTDPHVPLHLYVDAQFCQDGCANNGKATIYYESDDDDDGHYCCPSLAFDGTSAIELYCTYEIREAVSLLLNSSTCASWASWQRCITNEDCSCDVGTFGMAYRHASSDIPNGKYKMYDLNNKEPYGYNSTRWSGCPTYDMRPFSTMLRRLFHWLLAAIEHYMPARCIHICSVCNDHVPRDEMARCWLSRIAKKNDDDKFMSYEDRKRASRFRSGVCGHCDTQLSLYQMAVLQHGMDKVKDAFVIEQSHTPVDERAVPLCDGDNDTEPTTRTAKRLRLDGGDDDDDDDDS